MPNGNIISFFKKSFLSQNSPGSSQRDGIAKGMIRKSVDACEGLLYNFCTLLSSY